MDQQDLCYHDISGVESNKGWFECKKCGAKLRGAEAKALQGDYSGLPEGTTRIGALIIKKEGDNVQTFHGAIPETESQIVSPADIKKNKKEKAPRVETTLSSGKVVTGNVVTITCIDCGAERIIKVQDKFQVSRCVPCQKKFRNHHRYMKRTAMESKED